MSRAVALVLVMTLARVAHASTPGALAQLEAEQEALFDKISPSVVFIAIAGAFGSGFFVGESGLILTSAHVVGNQKTVKVVLSDGRRLKGEVVQRASDDVDLALVQVPLLHTPPLRLADDESLRVGAWVATVGHGAGGIWSFNSGMISNIYPEGVERPVFQTQIPINPGNSGGPIFDRTGRVVGVVTARLEKSEGVNFAIRSTVALQRLSRLSECACLVVTLPAGATLFVDGNRAGDGPRVIVPAEPRSYELSAVVGGVMQKRRVRYPAERSAHFQ